MFDVYLNTKRDLLVVRNGLPIPLPDASGRWHKKKKVASVSEDIKLAVQRQGYYLRKLTDFRSVSPRSVCAGVDGLSSPRFYGAPASQLDERKV